MALVVAIIAIGFGVLLIVFNRAVVNASGLHREKKRGPRRTFAERGVTIFVGVCSIVIGILNVSKSGRYTDGDALPFVLFFAAFIYMAVYVYRRKDD